MQCNINNVKRICGYNQAARYFEETKKPRSAKWSDDERPLYNTRSHHYRILKGEDNGVERDIPEVRRVHVRQGYAPLHALLSLVSLNSRGLRLL